MTALTLETVRIVAKAEGLKEAYFNEKSRVVSFARPGEEVNRIRFNIYYTTGTVGTCLNHPRQGRTQLFRRNVTLENLREIFRNPRIHTGVGYHRKDASSDAQQRGGATKRKKLDNGSSQAIQSKFPAGSRAYVKGFANCTVLSGVLGYSHQGGTHGGKIKVKYDNGTIYHVDPNQLEEVMEETFDEETAAKEQMKLLELEKAGLEEERKNLDGQISSVKAILDSFEEERRQKAEAERRENERLAQIAREKAKAEAARQKQAQIERERVDRGRYLDFLLISADHVAKKFNKTVTGISCGGSSTIMLYENGGWAWSSGLPKLLHNKLNGRQLSLPKPTYVAIGSQDRYYIRFADGKSEWVGCDLMTKTLNKKASSTVQSVAFGADWNSYFVVFSGGGWSYNNIPQGLVDAIERIGNRGDLSCVSLGPSGEYFVAAKNRRAWWGGMSGEGMECTRKYKDRIKFMDFGDNDAFLIRYS